MGIIECPVCHNIYQSLGYMRHQTMHTENLKRRFVLSGNFHYVAPDGKVSDYVDGEGFRFDGKYYHALSDGAMIDKTLFSKFRGKVKMVELQL